MENRPLLHGLVALAIALGFGPCVIGRGIGEVRRPEEAIAVPGSAKRPIRSDFVIWRASVGIPSPSAVTASSELRTEANWVRQFLRANGVSECPS